MDILRVDGQHSSCSTKPLIPTAKVDGADAILAKHRRTHDARLDGHIEVRLFEDADGMLRQDTSNGHELGVSCTIQGTIGLVHAPADDLAILDKDTADGSLIACESQFSLDNRMSQQMSSLIRVHR